MQKHCVLVNVQSTDISSTMASLASAYQICGGGLDIGEQRESLGQGERGGGRRGWGGGPDVGEEALGRVGASVQLQAEVEGLVQQVVEVVDGYEEAASC